MYVVRVITIYFFKGLSTCSQLYSVNTLLGIYSLFGLNLTFNLVIKLSGRGCMQSILQQSIRNSCLQQVFRKIDVCEHNLSTLRNNYLLNIIYNE